MVVVQYFLSLKIAVYIENMKPHMTCKYFIFFYCSFEFSFNNLSHVYFLCPFRSWCCCIDFFSTRKTIHFPEDFWYSHVMIAASEKLFIKKSFWRACQYLISNTSIYQQLCCWHLLWFEHGICICVLLITPWFSHLAHSS